MKIFGMSKRVYSLYGSYQYRQRQVIIRHRQYVNSLATTIFPLAALVGLFFGTVASATPPP
jgi:hypothetical protein